MQDLLNVLASDRDRQIASELPHANQVIGKALLERLRDRTLYVLIFLEKTNNGAGRPSEFMNGSIEFRGFQACLARVPFVREPRVIFDLLLKVNQGFENFFRRRRAVGEGDVNENKPIGTL